VPAGAFRGYGAPQAGFAIESTIDELARALAIDPIAFRRRNVIAPGEAMVSADTLDHDVDYRSNGLDQCLDLVCDALSREQAPARPPPRAWRVGQGVALTMIHAAPPRGHISDSRIALRESGNYELVFGTAEFGNGTSTVHCQVAATALATTIDRIAF